MPYSFTTATSKISRQRRRIRLNAGGTSAGKTISILQLLIDDAQTDVKPTLTSVVSESFPHLRRGCIRDFINIMQDHGYWEQRRWNKSEFTYDFPLIDPERNNAIVKQSGSLLEFFSADQPGKVRGPRRDRLFCNEVNNIEKESWEQLLLRTRQYAYADWNPVSDFFMYQEYGLVDEPTEGKKPFSTDIDVDFQILTYLDNEALEPAIITEIEKRKSNKAWFRPYGLGLRGELEGRIYNNWKITDDIPHEARLERRGLDFGYSHDPAAIVDVYYYNGGYILDEKLYQIGVSNRSLAQFLQNMEQPNVLTIADSAEPKSIDELKLHGVSVTPAIKGQGSLNQGIQYVQDQRISVTKRSVNLLKEYRRYMWQTDKAGNILKTPEGGADHLLDAVRYAFSNMRSGPAPQVYKPRNMLEKRYGRDKPQRPLRSRRA